MPLKVALYYPWIYLTGGAERVIVELTGRSEHEWTIFTHHYRPECTFPEFAERHVVALKEVSVERSVAATARAAYTILSEKIDLTGFDALLVVCEGMGDLVALREPTLPKVCCCLTPMRAAFDPAYIGEVSKDASSPRRASIYLGGIVFRFLDRLAWKRYAATFFISREAGRRAEAGALVPRGTAKIVHPGLGFEPELSPTSECYFLLPGRIMWTKNIQLGIEAFLHMRAQRPELGHFRLIVAGVVNQKSSEYYQYLRTLCAGCDHVEFHLAPTDAALRELYRNSYAVLFTAFNEDWGIVPIEAMAFGKPVIAVNRGGPLESIAHGVQGFLEPPEAGAFATRMAELAADPALAQALGEKGWQRAHDFSWNNFVRHCDHALVEVCRAVPVSAPRKEELC